MAKDPAVSSIEVSCLQRPTVTHISLPDSDDFSPDAHDTPGLHEVEAVPRRLNVREGVPWGIDRIDGTVDSKFDDGDLTGKGVRVYIVDTGVQGTHLDFGGRVVDGHTALVRTECDSCQAVNGILPSNGSGCSGHGTHVASIVGGLIYGVAKEVTIVPATSCFKRRCQDGVFGCGSSADIAANLEWALVDCEAHPESRCVVQRSISGGFLIQDAALLNANVLVVAAAGNSPQDPCATPRDPYYSPLLTPDKLIVGATTERDAMSSFSNYGACVHVQAPGSSILAAYVGASNNATRNMSGTSMAAPHVSGVAAQLLAVDSTLSVGEVKQMILAAAERDSLDLSQEAEDAGTPNRLLIGGAGIKPFVLKPRPPRAPPSPPPTPHAPLVTVAGGCNFETGDVRSGGALDYVLQGTTASGAPYYKAAEDSVWLYWDLDCYGKGSGFTGWFLDNNEPNTTSAMDLDGDGSCDIIAFISSFDSSSPPQGPAKWTVFCDGAWTDTYLTISQPGMPPRSPPLPPNSPPGLCVEITLVRGWQMISFNCIEDSGGSFDIIQNAGIFRTDDKIMTRDGELLFSTLDNSNPPRFMGSLKRLSSSLGYRVFYSGEEGKSLVQGGGIQFPEKDVVLKPGWNWIGHVPLISYDINSGIEPVSGQFTHDDQFKTRSGSDVEFSTYADSEFGFVGNLAELKPGNGYEVRVKMAVTFRYNATSF